MSQGLLYLFSSSSWIWPTAYHWSLFFPYKQQRKKAERAEADGWAELDQLRGRYSSGRACCFLYPTFILAPLQHRTPRMGFTIPDFKCVQWIVSSETCSEELYLRRKPFPLFTVEGEQPRAPGQRTGRHVKSGRMSPCCPVLPGNTLPALWVQQNKISTDLWQKHLTSRMHKSLWSSRTHKN